MVLPSTETYNILGIFRIYVGLAWLIFGSTKIFGNFLSPQRRADEYADTHSRFSSIARARAPGT